MAERYLWSPLRLGPVTVRNRIVFSRPPHELRRGRPAHRAARRLLRGPRRRRRRAHHHRGALDPPDRLALREADPRLPPRGHPRLPAHHRRRPPPPHADLRPDQPQRRPGVVDVHPPAGVGAVAGGRSAVPRGAQGGRRAPRSPRSWPATPLVAEHCARGRLRRHRAAVLALARSCAASCRRPPTVRTDGYGGSLEQPGPAAARDRRRRARGHRPRPGARRAPLRRRADRGRHHHRRGRRGGRAGRGHAATSTTSTPRSAWPPPACS